MSGWLVALIILAVGLLGFGARVLSEQIGRFPTDFRRPGALVQIRRTKPTSFHTPELRRLTTVISYAVLDDQSAKVELQQVFDDLEAPVSPLVAADGTRRGRLRRIRKIEQAIEALEQRYRL